MRKKLSEMNKIGCQVSQPLLLCIDKSSEIKLFSLGDGVFFNWDPMYPHNREAWPRTMSAEKNRSASCRFFLQDDNAILKFAFIASLSILNQRRYAMCVVHCIAMKCHLC